ncbi:MAG: hypothetical protein GY854_30665 [Deltaproteobacteria bacterium]|nr:hypothetical protein [Deltaproteobacteria bacterium]
MFSFQDIALFSLGAAVVVDTALLLVLAEGRNRRRIASALLVLVSGAWMFHIGVFGDMLSADATGNWVVWLRKIWMTLVVLGGLLMPSALVHWLARLYRTGLAVIPNKEPKYLIAYLPLVALPFVLTRSDVDFQSGVVGTFGPPFAYVYAAWVAAINLVAAAGLVVLWRRENLVGARRLLVLMVATLLASTVLQLVLTMETGLSPSAHDIVWLAAVVSPVFLSLLFGYFIVRFNFMQIVLERSMLYGAMLIAAFLCHHLFLRQLWTSLSDRYHIDFSILVGALLIVLLLIVEPARKRSSEALRYLLGERMERLRKESRDLALKMSSKIGLSTDELLEWFAVKVCRMLGLSFVAVWRVEGQTINARGGDTQRLDDEQVIALQGQMIERGFSLSTRRFWHSTMAERALVEADASMIVSLNHERVSALLVFGRRGFTRSLSDEQITASQMLVEQLGITITNNLLQTERLATEHRLHEQNKLSMLGMVASSIAHEVKNPLSSIKTISTLLAEELGSDNRFSEELSIIRCEIDRLSETVTQMLHFVRPAGNPSDRVSLVESLRGAVRLMQHMAKKRGVSITFESGDDVSPVHADSGGIREIFFNLIGNAIDAADKTEGGNVRVRVEADPNAVVVTIEDNGEGIDPGAAKRIFEPFVTTKAEGTGLGLYIAKERADQMGAELSCQSRPEGGTVFTVRFTRD